jgi:hypothetical protein
VGSSLPIKPAETAVGSSLPIKPAETAVGSSLPIKPAETDVGSSLPIKPAEIIRKKFMLHDCFLSLVTHKDTFFSKYFIALIPK